MVGFLRLLSRAGREEPTWCCERCREGASRLMTATHGSNLSLGLSAEEQGLDENAEHQLLQVKLET
jgi:hypothetical protein